MNSGSHSPDTRCNLLCRMLKIDQDFMTKTSVGDVTLYRLLRACVMTKISIWVDMKVVALESKLIHASSKSPIDFPFALCPRSPGLHNPIRHNNLAYIGIHLPLDNSPYEHTRSSRIHSSHLRVRLLASPQTSSQEARADGPHLDSVLVQHAMPFAHHHIHARLCAAVSGDGGPSFGPAGRRVFVDWQSHVFGAGESGGAGGDEKEAGMRGGEEEGHEGRSHDLRAGCVDVPRCVPHFTLA